MELSDQMNSDARPPTLTHQPDIMNDPAYDTNTQRNDKNPEDADTCRICRGEGSHEEPLFYPCKCSGSIKFVHQSCLMEWLSHSQKKHCELCKTPFRFTKLYDAHMPKSVPILVFLRQATVHTWRSLLTWSRLHLVAFVWIFWLPWCMRAVWRGLFWVGDGNWVDWRKRSLQDAVASISSQLPASTTAYPPSLPSSTDAIASDILSQFSSKLSRIWSTTRLFKLGRGEPLTLRVLKSVYRSFSTKGAILSSPLSNDNMTVFAGPAPRSASWLSEFPLLRSFTRSTTLNNLIIDTLEGQLITMFIVVAFILIFLIREWVMQQQQNLLMGPDGARDAVPPENPAARVQQHAELQADGQGAEQAVQVQIVPDGADNGILARPAARILARPRRRLQRRATLPEIQDPGQVDESAADDANDAIGPPQENSSDAVRLEVHDASPIYRPTMPDRGVIARAVEIRRTLDEHSRILLDADGSGAWVFKDLWSRARQDPSEVLRIIELEGRTEELDWIVNFMKKLEGAPHDVRLSAASKVGYLSKNDQEVFTTKLQDFSSDDGSFELVDAQPPSSAQFQSSGAPSQGPEPGLDDSHGPSENSAAEITPARNDQVIEPSTPSLQPNRDSSDISGIFLPSALSDSEMQDFGEGTAGISSLTRPPSTDVNRMPMEESTEENVDSPQDLAADAAVDPLPPSQSLLESLKEVLWGGVVPPNDPVEQLAGDEEHVINDVANEAPFVPIAHGQHLIAAENQEAAQAQDPDVIAAAIQAGINPNGGEAIDDIEDLEGVMELIGMQGPLVGLIQNGMFCALLVSLTIAAALWVPYMFGKIFLTVLDNPIRMLKQPLRFASTSADMVVDLCIFAAGCSFFWVDTVISMACAPVGWLIPSIRKITQNKVLAETAKEYAERALERLADASIANGDFVTKAFDVPRFSVVAHESLYNLESHASAFLENIVRLCAGLIDVAIRSEGVRAIMTSATDNAMELGGYLVGRVSSLLNLAAALLQMNPLRINLTHSHRTAPFDYTLAAWNAKDRFIAIVCGYVFFALLGVVYLYLAAAIRGTNKKGRVESGLADVLYQAGGVMKVVLIISIEMIVFPLYCGLLLDAALLPLFGNATFISRVEFIAESPNTSLFIHWFVGTCYMFHFALFVSMCRKILRTGVLCESISNFSFLIQATN